MVEGEKKDEEREKEIVMEEYREEKERKEQERYIEERREALSLVQERKGKKRGQGEVGRSCCLSISIESGIQLQSTT